MLLANRSGQDTVLLDTAQKLAPLPAKKELSSLREVCPCHKLVRATEVDVSIVVWIIKTTMGSVIAQQHHLQLQRTTWHIGVRAHGWCFVSVVMSKMSNATGI